MARRRALLPHLICGLFALVIVPIGLAEDGPDAYARAVPAAVRGPFISDPAVLQELDCPDASCNGPLNFARLMQARSHTRYARTESNPFNLPVSSKILSIVESDLTDLRVVAGATNGQLSPKFLTDEGSRVELVGIINRMDRQFIRDPSVGLTRAQLDCGELAVIYRFGYSIRGGKQKSRLPVTLNLVLPALPARPGVTCQAIARRWVNELDAPAGRTPKQYAADLLDKRRGPLAFIDGRDLLRVELNMQAYRKPASQDEARFGTHAAYLIRVFKWDDKTGLFLPEFLRDQIDRTAVLCGPADSDSVCAAKKTRRRQLVRFLSRPAVMSAIDKGTLEVRYDLGVLATRAVSISPGGAHRSANQPYWKANAVDQDVITDDELDRALAAAKRAGVQFSFVKSRDDLRTRLNESSCTGCHQTRAIAGFHFPGADRPDTPAANSVLLPGSPHFYGDQPRRADLVRKIARGLRRRLSEYDLATSYSGRPMSRYTETLASTQLIGGWGGTCLMPDALAASQRVWNCREDLRLTCAQLFESDNDPGTGTCVPDGRFEVGDALQRGVVVTSAYGTELYTRVLPVSTDARIPVAALPPDAPPDNSFYGAHQEFYAGDPNSTDYATRRDASTGGFPAGMLRLSECRGLPPESTCGLIASSGFNACIGRIAADPDYTIDVCFQYFTSYAGLRACDAASPCRDDYICVKPMGYTPANAATLFQQRLDQLVTAPYFRAVNNRPYDPKDYGQQQPDQAWVQRDDQRGICIPPYFVFQFRSDGHPAPPPVEGAAPVVIAPALESRGR